ncbi:MAG: efflux RND transporter permease subunit [Treponemataceae bacterium]
MNLSKKTLEHPVLVFCVFALIVVVACFTFGGIKIDLMPDMEFPYVVVMTSYNNAGPETVEKSVTEVIESGLVSVSNLKKLYSSSSEGSSVIELEFNYGTDLDSAINDVRDKLDMVKSGLPNGAGTPQIFRFDSSSMPIMTLAVNGNRTEDELKKIADEMIADRLEQVNGVAKASVKGGRDSVVRVELDQNRMEAYGLTVSSVVNSISSQNIEVGGGNVSEGTRKYMVRTTGEFSSLEEIKGAVVGNYNGYSLRICDIGKVYMGFNDTTSSVYINGKPGIYISIQKQSGSNTVNVSDGVYKKLEQIKELLPSDVKIEIINDTSTEVRDTLSELVKSILEGFVLSVLILFFLLRSGKSTFIMAISIPFSIVLTLLIMNLKGISLNMITMTGLILGLGMVVDASVVVLENIYVYRNRGTQAITAAAIGTQEVLSSVVSGNLTTVCVFIPFLLFKNRLGIMGNLFNDLMIVIIIALLSSLFVAIFLVPILAGKFLPIDNRKETPIKNKFLAKCDRKVENGIEWVKSKYRKALHYVLRHRFATCIISFGILVSSILLFGRLNITFMSHYNDTSVGLNVELPLGTKLEETEAILSDFYKFAEEEIKGAEKIIVTVGTSGGFSFGDDSSYKGSLTIYLPDASKQIDNAEKVKEKLRVHFDEYPVANFTFSQGQMQKMGGSDIDIVFRCESLAEGLAVSKQVAEIIKNKIPQVMEPKIDLEDGLPQVEIKIDRERAAAFGISIMAIANEINYCINGKTATVYHKDGKSYYVNVILEDEDRDDIPDLKKIYVAGTKGLYPVSNFARIVRGTGPVTINREDQARTIHLTANVAGGMNAGKAENLIKEAIDENLVVPEGITISYEGSWKKSMDTAKIFIMIIILAVILVFGVMAGTYESFKNPFINMFTMPFLIVGVVLIHFITGQSFSMVSAIGIVMLVGIVVNNGIILVDQINLLVNRGVSLLQSCEDAGVSRLRPVLMTTLTTILGMIPMAFFGGDSASVTQPIGLCVIGGLTSSTLVTLFIIPVIYSIFNKNADKKDTKKFPSEFLEQFEKEDMEEVPALEDNKKNKNPQVIEEQQK